MTLARTALRLCTVGVLLGADGARPTMASNRVWDSRIADLSPEAYENDALATIIVTTDNDDGEALSSQNGGPPFKRNVSLLIEFGMTEAVRDDGGYSIVYPDTDARLEASLDLLEFQIVRAMAEGLTPLAIQFRKMARIWSRACHRQVDDQHGLKMACRILELKCEVTDDRDEIYNTALPLPTGNAALPQPLRDVAALLPDGSSGAQICAAIAAAIAPITAAPLEGADFIIDAKPSDPDATDTKISAPVEFDQP